MCPTGRFASTSLASTGELDAFLDHAPAAKAILDLDDLQARGAAAVCRRRAQGSCEVAQGPGGARGGCPSGPAQDRAATAGGPPAWAAGAGCDTSELSCRIHTYSALPILLPSLQISPPSSCRRRRRSGGRRRGRSRDSRPHRRQRGPPPPSLFSAMCSASGTSCTGRRMPAMRMPTP